jgi:hypothetical protein
MELSLVFGFLALLSTQLFIFVRADDSYTPEELVAIEKVNNRAESRILSISLFPDIPKWKITFDSSFVLLSKMVSHRTTCMKTDI